MAILLGLLIICLGLYFLSLFFQVARLEKELQDGVVLVEKYMVVTYAMIDKKPANADTEAGDAAPPSPAAGA